ncbi:Crp/Fnr family transcriptional regulator [Rhodopseudomonas palustris]|uniref:Transcriptional regulator, Crp/Fnr family n=1 Tax=Rhodopseudomonas palustris (strain BisB18) TaxID=316056 RepID=Q212F5_RHOPB
MQSGPSLIELLASETGAALRAIFRERNLPAGTLFDAAEFRDHVFVIKSGRLRIFLATTERELSLAYLGAGDMFSTHTRAHLQAVQPTTLLMAPRELLEHELAHYPALRATIIRVLARVLSQAMTLVEDLAFHNVRGRIARYLLRSAGRHKAPLQNGSLIRIDLQMEEIAALLGTTRQTVSTEFNAMLHAGVLVRHDRRRYGIQDLARLQAFASEGDGVG